MTIIFVIETWNSQLFSKCTQDYSKDLLQQASFIAPARFF